MPNITFAMNDWMFGKTAGISEVMNRITKIRRPDVSIVEQ